MILFWTLYMLTTMAYCKRPFERGRDFWYNEAWLELQRRLALVDDRPKARNVILLVGDGMGVVTQTAARILKGQHPGGRGIADTLAWDHFPALALAKTYNLNAQVGESAACATALLCGVKANYETIGLDSGGKFGNCSSAFDSRVDSILDWAQRAGLATGLVTNTRVSHATPAALYGHSPSRYWEDDSKVPLQARRSCKDISRQLVEDDPGRHIHVVLGGGRRHWLPRATRDPENPSESGRRMDGRHLVEDWLRDQGRRTLRAKYVWTTEQLEALNVSCVDRLLGLFAPSHLAFEADRPTGPEGDPSLALMTRVALSLLTRNSKGFFLLVESGRIDHAHHINYPHRALEETLALEAALLEVLNATDPKDTLVVLTSDHSHVLTFGGLNTPVDNPVLGVDSSPSDVDGRPYSTLLYGNGPGYDVPRMVPSNGSSIHGATVPRRWATHGGEDVPVFAQGPLATTLFTGTIDQTVIPHAIAYICCLGEYSGRCSGGEDFPATDMAQSYNLSATAHPPTQVSAPAYSEDVGLRIKSSANSSMWSIFLLLLMFML